MILKFDYKQNIRERREQECFPVINRGTFWYEKLSDKQRIELKEWYQAWLDAPDTQIIPSTPAWINDKLEDEVEEILI